MFENILRSIQAAGSGHPGGSVTALPILEWLYFKHMCPQPYDFSDPDRDICILSKGHAAPALYAVFERMGILSHQEMLNLRKLSEPAQGHPATRWLPHVITSTGSLGQGLAVAAGMALANGRRRVFCVVGDGDMQEGIATEVARFAVSQKLENLVVVWDKNDALSDEYSVVYSDIPWEWSVAGWSVFVGFDYQSMRGKPSLLVIKTDKTLPHGSVTLSDEDVDEMLGKAL